jgi:hypothetical protein
MLDLQYDLPDLEHKAKYGRQFAERLLDEKYGRGNYPTGPGSEFNKIKKWGDRAFE